MFTGGLVVPGQGTWDTNTHGTHVAGEAAGTAEGSTDAEKGAYPGVAPEASIIAGRIAIDVTALTDDMLAAAEWAVIDQKADVVNLSFGIDVRYGVLTDQYDPQSAGFEALAINPSWGYPSIMTSAGNAGDRFSTIGVPSAALHLNTIAATVKDWDAGLGAGETTESGGDAARGVKDALGLIHPSVAQFSSRGPTQDLYFAPDLSAPGGSIVAAYSNQNTDGSRNGYASFSGTSMASPHAAGAAALLVDAYRQRFGTKGPFGNRPPFWVIAAALGNTAGTTAARPAFGAASPGKRVSYAGVGPDALFQLFGSDASRENRQKAAIPVGSLVEGAGRVNIPAAWSALTEGVLIHTIASVAGAPTFYDLQASIQGNTVKPRESLTRTLHLRPATGHLYELTLAAASGVPSVNAKAIPPSWWTLPATTFVSGASGSDVDARITVPAETTPGPYTGYLLARVRDTVTGEMWRLRLPAMVVVEVTDAFADEGEGKRSDVNGFGYAITDTTFVTNIFISDSVNNDWTTYAVDIPAGLERLDLAVRGTSGNADEWDLFVYDERGLVLADTFQAPPENDPTLSVSGLEKGASAWSSASPSRRPRAWTRPTRAAFPSCCPSISSARRAPSLRLPARRRPARLLAPHREAMRATCPRPASPVCPCRCSGSRRSPPPRCSAPDGAAEAPRPHRLPFLSSAGAGGRVIEEIVVRVGPVFAAAGYWIIAGAVMLERSIFVGLIIPGDIVLALGGIYAARDELALPWVIVVAVLAALAGESTGYWLGRRYGRRLVARVPLVRRLEPRFDAAQEYFARRGAATVFVGRFATAAGAFIPFVAGVARMPFGRFLLVDIPAIIVWAGAIATVGYAFGSNLDRVERILSRFGLIALAILVVLIGGRALLRRRKQPEPPA